MKEKQLIITAPYKVEMVEKTVEEPKEAEVQVRLAVSTISSGTERANLVGEINVNGAVILKEAHFPRYIGYSSSGVIEKVGKNVTEFKKGDRVALSWSVHATLQNIHKDNVHKIIDDSIPFEEAALWHISTFPMAAIRKCGLEIGESAIVMGVGILGIFGIKQLLSAGAAPVIAVDPNPEKRKLALAIGADYAFDPFDDDFARKVKEVTNGGANVALEVTGVGAGLDGVTGEDFGMVVFKYKNGVSFAKTCAYEKGGFSRRQLVVCGSKGTIELKPLEWYYDISQGLQFTSRSEKYDVNWYNMGIHTDSTPEDRYDRMMLSFAEMCKEKKKNTYSYDYELSLYKLILRSCGVKL